MATFASDSPLFVPTSCFDGNPVSALNTMDGYPASNLTNSMIRLVYKSDLVSYSGTITGPLGSTILYLENTQLLPINCLMLLNHNLSAGDTLSIVAWTVLPAWGAFWTISVDSSGTVNPCQMYYFGTNVVNYQYWQISIIPATERIVQVGRVFAGNGIQLAHGIKDGYSIERIDRSNGDVMNGRQGFWSTKTHYQRIYIDPGQLDENETGKLLALYKIVGLSSPFVFALRPRDALQNTYYVQFVDQLRQTHVVNRRFITNQIVLEEKI